MIHRLYKKAGVTGEKDYRICFILGGGGNDSFTAFAEFIFGNSMYYFVRNGRILYVLLWKLDRE